MEQYLSNLQNLQGFRPSLFQVNRIYRYPSIISHQIPSCLNSRIRKCVHFRVLRKAIQALFSSVRYGTEQV